MEIEKRMEILIVNRVDLIMDYIHQIVEDTDEVLATMDFGVSNIDGKKMCTLDIRVPKKEFERHLNLDIPGDYLEVLYEEFLNRIQNDNTLSASGISSF